MLKQTHDFTQVCLQADTLLAMKKKHTQLVIKGAADTVLTAV